MKKSRYHSIAFAVTLPLAIALWQSSSCRSGNSSSGNNTSMNANSSPVTGAPDLRGQWAGEHISMEVTDEGAQIEYDCAHGRLTEKIVPDRDGKFEAKGFHTQERGGPVRLGEDNEQPAVYRGSINEETMRLTVELTANHETVGTFTLTHGKAGRIRKCL